MFVLQAEAQCAELRAAVDKLWVNPIPHEINEFSFQGILQPTMFVLQAEAQCADLRAEMDKLQAKLRWASAETLKVAEARAAAVKKAEVAAAERNALQVNIYMYIYRYIDR